MIHNLPEMTIRVKQPFEKRSSLKYWYNEDHSSKTITRINYNVISFSSPPACSKVLTEL